MKLLIATPTFDGKIDCETYLSIVSLLNAAIEHRLGPVMVQTKTATLIDRARNIFASMMLNDPSITHLLFIDADMGFRPEAILRMLSFNKPVVGIIYPQRKTPLKFVASEQIMRSTLTNGFVRAGHVGTGIMLIQRSAIEAIRDTHPELYLPNGHASYADAGAPGPILQAFAPIREDNGVVISEDISFCMRWTATGGKIWALTDEVIHHAGRQVVKGKFSDHMGTK